MAVDWSSVEQARTGAQQAGQTAVDYASKGNTLADELRKAIGERYGQSGIAQDTAKARTDFMASAPQARSQILDMVNAGTILSPTQQNAIMAAKRGSALMPLMGANLVNDAAFGTIEDLINAGTNAWNAKSTAAQGAAGLAQKSYSDMLGEIMSKAQLEQAQEPKTTIWEDASGNSWIINATTGEKIQNLGSSYHAPSAAGQITDWDFINSLKNEQNSGYSSGGQWVNSQGQTWTDSSKIPVGTFIGKDGKTYTEYSDGSVGSTIWNYKESGGGGSSW